MDFRFQGKPVVFWFNPPSLGGVDVWQRLRNRSYPNHEQFWFGGTDNFAYLDVYDALYYFDSGPLTVAPHIGKVSYDNVRSFTHLGHVCGSGSMLAVHPSVAARYFLQAFVPPNGFNWPQWNDPPFEEAFAALETARDPAAFNAAYARAHERLVDNPPWLYIVHDLNPRAMSRRVRGFTSVQSWFQDLVPVDLQ